MPEPRARSRMVLEAARREAAKVPVPRKGPRSRAPRARVPANPIPAQPGRAVPVRAVREPPRPILVQRAPMAPVLEEVRV